MQIRANSTTARFARVLANAAARRVGTVALATTWLFAVGCGGQDPESDRLESRQAGLTLSLSSPTTFTLASTAIPGGITVSGGTAPYTCAIGINTSGGTSCSATGGTINYTPGASAGFNIKANRTGDYLLNNAGRCETGGLVGTSAELFLMAASGTGYTFQLKSTNKYVHTTGTSLYCDGTSSETYLLQGCANGTNYNRYGFASISGSSPYWKGGAPTIDTYTGGNGSACNPGDAGAWEAFFLVPGVDQLTITDSLSNTGTLQVTVEKPLFFSPSTQTVNASTAISPVQVLGGSGTFTGGSSACAVITNLTGSAGTCTVTGGGSVSYTAGPTNATDTLRVTDSQGHTGTFTVQVSPAFSLSASTSYAIAQSALGTSVTVSGGSGSGTYSCAVSTNTSHFFLANATCNVSGSSLSFTAGSIAGYNIRVNRTGDYVRLVSATGGPYLQTGGAVGSSAELFKVTLPGTGLVFQSTTNSSYVRAMGTVSAGNDLVADAATGDVFTLQNCNGAGDPTHYNRWGFKSLTGSNPYWKSVNGSVYIDAKNNGNGSACDPTYGGAWEAFYLDLGQDVLTITDTAGHSGTVTVTIEPPITFSSSSMAVAGATPVTNQALGGNGIFTGGSSSCAVTRNATGGGTCTTTAWGTVSYTPGSTAGTDTITLTDSVGHTGYFTVAVGVSLSQLSAGPSYFSCAKVSDGTASCWGINLNGELGQGFPSPNSTTAVTVKGLTGVTAVVTGENHACALLSNNTVKCWGDNDYGQLGNNSFTDSWSPVTVSGISTAIAISAGMLHTCVLLTGGTVSCWGQNASYQIGNSTASAWPVAKTPVTVTGLSSVSAIAAGGFHNCALTTGGAVKCWGDDSFGALGNGSTVNSFAPVAVTGLSSGVSSIAAGEQHSCAVSSGYVKCWGDNTYGQLGDGTKTQRTTPVSVQSLTGVADVAAGYPFTCARLTNKTVKCWGRNVEGEIGDTTSTERLIPTAVAALNTANSISAGGVNACAALSSGLGTCWGYNLYGQIGNGSTTDVHTPTGVAFGCATCNQPDVLVAATSWSPQAVSAGGNVTFSATVFNAGTGTTPVGTILGMRWDIDGAQTNYADQLTTGLAPGASVTITANGGGGGSTWTTTSGSHTLQGWVDDVNRFTESDETNNKLSSTMTLGMDLVVSSLTWSPSTPGSGTQTTFSCVVKNIGTAATPGGTILGVRFDIDGVMVNFEDTYTTSLAAGASVTLTATGGTSGRYWTATSGPHTLQGWGDDVNRFGEPNRGNNTTTTTFVVP